MGPFKHSLAPFTFFEIVGTIRFIIPVTALKDMHNTYSDLSFLFSDHTITIVSTDSESSKYSFKPSDLSYRPCDQDILDLTGTTASIFNISRWLMTSGVSYVNNDFRIRAAKPPEVLLDRASRKYKV